MAVGIGLDGMGCAKRRKSRQTGSGGRRSDRCAELVERDGRGLEGNGWDGMGWDGMGRDGMGWDGTGGEWKGRDIVRKDAGVGGGERIGCDGTRRDERD